MMFGEKLRQARRKAGLTLTALCEEYGLVPSNHSTLERGLSTPPDNPRYHRVYAELFGLQMGSPEWEQFLDELAIARKHIPDDVCGDFRLPLIFKALRSTKDLDQLIEMMKGK